MDIETFCSGNSLVKVYVFVFQYHCKYFLLIHVLLECTAQLTGNMLRTVWQGSVKFMEKKSYFKQRY